LRKPAKPPFQEVRSSQLSDSDKALFADISPNGRYVAMVVWDGKPHLSLKDLETNNITTLVPPSDDEYSGNTFSVDGQSVYYAAWGQNDPTPTLYRVSLTGEDRQKVFDNVGGKISFSPDGRQFAFVRFTDDGLASNLVIGNMETKEERVIASRHSPDRFLPAGPSWSHDGKLIACATLDGKTSSMNVLAVNPGTGVDKFLSPDEWHQVFSVTWLPDNSGLIMVAKRKGELPLLWHLSYPEGICRRITNEPSHYLSTYTSLSLSADAKKLIASRLEHRTNVWVSDSSDANTLEQVTFGGNHWFRFVAWAPGEKIIFPSDLSGNRELWIMDVGGSNQRQLTNSPGIKTLPVATADGRYVVYSVGTDGNRKLWRMDIDGGNPVQLTNGEDDWGGSCTPDSQWLFYTSGAPEKTKTIWKVTIAGGDPIQVTKNSSMQPVISPDGKQIACAWETQNKEWKIAILPISGGEPTALLEPVPGDPIGPVRWAANGQAILYCKIRNQVANIWSHPINGDAPKQLTDFKSENIERFDVSQDGRLLLSRGFTARDIVLIEDIGR
jgi:Tol biopolymer transport system component